MSPDSDTDITALIGQGGFASLKQNAPGSTSDPSSATGRPTFGHPTKMVSSRKQKADPFIRQKTRPEFHLDSRVSGPKPPTYQDRKPPPMQMFDSNAYTNSFTAPPAPRLGEEVFYTDPAKASADLKALLEGGMEEDEEEQAEGNNKAEQAEQDRKNGAVEGLKVKLLPHQVEGVEWMKGRELGPVKRGKVPKGGILAGEYCCWQSSGY